MTEKAANQKAGKRRGRVEVTKRLALVRELLKAYGDDHAAARAEFVDLFGPTPERTFASYVRKVHDGVVALAAAREPDDLDAVRRAYLDDLRADIELYRANKAWSAMRGARKDIGEVEGVFVQRVDVRGALTLTPGRPANHEPEDLTDGERAELARIAAEHTTAQLVAAPVAANDTTDAASERSEP
jgi:hypothetical protein